MPVPTNAASQPAASMIWAWKALGVPSTASTRNRPKRSVAGSGSARVSWRSAALATSRCGGGETSSTAPEISSRQLEQQAA